MRKLLPNVSRPYSNEIFSSWIHRGFRSGADSRFAELIGLCRLHNIADLDRDDVELIELAANIFALPKAHFSSMFPSRNYWIIPSTYRNLYCPGCLLADIKHGNIPGYRISWVYRWSIVCPIHGFILESTGRVGQTAEDTVSSAIHSLAKDKLHMPPPITTRASQFSAHVGYVGVAFYFQQWIAGQIRSEKIMLPTGQTVSAKDFFRMIDIVCLSAMRPARAEERYIPDTYSYLPPRKWPSEPLKGSEVAHLPFRDPIAFAPSEKAGLLAYLGLLVGVPKCCSLWRILAKRSSYYSCPSSKSLFPDDDRGLRDKIRNMLAEENNPLLDTATTWFDIDLQRQAGIVIPELFK